MQFFRPKEPSPIVIPTIRDKMLTSGDSSILTSLLQTDLKVYGQYLLQQTGSQELVDGAISALLSTQALEQSELDFGIARMQEQVTPVIRENKGKVIALIGEQGKSGEGMWFKYFSHLIPTAFDVFGQDDSWEILRRPQYDKYNLVIIDDVSLWGSTIEEIFYAVTNYGNAVDMIKRIRGIFTLIKGNDTKYDKNLAGISTSNVFEVTDLYPQISQIEPELMKSIFGPQVSTYHVVISGEFRKITDTFLPALTAEGLSNAKMDPRMAAIRMNNWVPFYKTDEHRQKLETAILEGKVQIINR